MHITGMRVEDAAMSDYRLRMLRWIRAFLSVVVAAFVATSVVMTPANAVAMIDCGTGDPASAAHSHDSQDLAATHFHDVAEDAAQDQHLPEHCASHACILALHHIDAVDGPSFLLGPMEAVLQDASLIDLSDPDALRRPPRS